MNKNPSIVTRGTPSSTTTWKVPGKFTPKLTRTWTTATPKTAAWLVRAPKNNQSTIQAQATATQIMKKLIRKIKKISISKSMDNLRMNISRSKTVGTINRKLLMKMASLVKKHRLNKKRILCRVFFVTALRALRAGG